MLHRCKIGSFVFLKLTVQIARFVIAKMFGPSDRAARQ
jgi:hypothetical protein